MNTDWKNNPVVIAAISVAATATFFSTVVSPTIEKHNNNQIFALKEKSLSLQNSILEKEKEKEKLLAAHQKGLEEKRNTIEAQERKIEALNTEVEKYKNEDRFSKEDPIPKGLRGIKIFSSYSEIKEEYSKEDFSEDTLYTSIDIDDKLFSQATYYPSKCKDITIVNEIRLFYRTAFDDYEFTRKGKDFDYLKTPVPTDEDIDTSRKIKKEALLEIFNEKYGKPKAIIKEQDHIFIINDSLAASINNHGLYIISRYTEDELEKLCNGQSICPLPAEEK